MFFGKKYELTPEDRRDIADILIKYFDEIIEQRLEYVRNEYERKVEDLVTEDYITQEEFLDNVVKRLLKKQLRKI
jgi:hypothetical protein